MANKTIKRMRKKRGNRKTSKKIYGGGEKIAPSPYFVLTKATYLNDEGQEDFCLYGKNRIVQILKDLNLNDDADKFLTKYNDLYVKSKELLSELIRDIDQIYEKMQTLEESVKAEYEAIVANRWLLFGDMNDILYQGLINPQMESSDDRTYMMTLIKQYISNATPDKSFLEKYTLHKNFVNEMFSEKLFTPSALFVIGIKSYSTFYEPSDFEVKWRKQKPLTPVQKQYNKDIDTLLDKKNYSKKIGEIKSSFVQTIREALYSVTNKYMRDEFPSIINNVVSETDDDHLLVLKKGSRIYRCVPTTKKTTLTEKNKSFLWYGFEPVSIISYALPQDGYPRTISEFCSDDHENSLGYIGTFVVKDDLKLLNLLNPSIIDYLTSIVKEEDNAILTTINKILYIEDSSVKRRSEINDDKNFVRWLCKNGFNGYIATTNASGTLHPEICLCDPTNKLENYDEDNITALKSLFHFCKEDTGVDFYINYYW